MFETDLAELSTAHLLESAAECRALANRADARLLEHALAYADRFHPSAHPSAHLRRSCDGRERAVVLGGEGCPEITEFAVAEFGVLLGVSPGVAAGYLGNALALRHRFRFTWARVLAGEATPWKACRIVAERSKLSEEAAAYVDQRVAKLIDSITPYRLDKIIKAARLHVDPDGARAEAAQKDRERGVFVGRSNEHGTKTMYIKAAAGAIARNDATIAAIADALKVFGDTRPVQVRRAEAVGIIADARYTQELLTQARHHRLTNPAPDTADAPDGTVGVADTSGEDAAETASSLAATGTEETGAGASSALVSTTADTAEDTTVTAAASEPPSAARSGWASGSWWGDRDLLHGWTGDGEEPGLDEEADRDAPHPSTTDLPDPLDAPLATPFEPFGTSDPESGTDLDYGGEAMDAAARRALRARLAQIKQDAYTDPAHGTRVRPAQTEIYVHLTDHTLAAGIGVLRAETLGPMLADQLTELVGHGPYTVKPIIDLNDALSVDAYEIPDRIRERVKLTHPVELFPFGTQETRRSMDLDHLEPYDPLGPPRQTATTNLAPLGRFGHRVKTHAKGWNVRRIDRKTLEWTTPHGFTFHVDPTGTHRIRGSAGGGG